MHRFYCPDATFSAKQIIINDANELHHLRDVLRLKKGAPVYLFDGKGREAKGMLLSVTSGKATVEIQSVTQHKRQKPSIILACALPKKSKFELIVEKATELGVDEIFPLHTGRTEIHLKGSRREKKSLRYQTVAINAAKQSQRIFIPKIHPITEFTSALKQLTETTQAIIPSLTGRTQPLLKVLENLDSPKAVSFFIGPEGDFTSQEYTLAHEGGCLPVTLGPTVLRVETAALCTISCANLYFRS